MGLAVSLKNTLTLPKFIGPVRVRYRENGRESKTSLRTSGAQYLRCGNGNSGKSPIFNGQSKSITVRDLKNDFTVVFFLFILEETCNLGFHLAKLLADCCWLPKVRVWLFPFSFDYEWMPFLQQILFSKSHSDLLNLLI